MKRRFNITIKRSLYSSTYIYLLLIWCWDFNLLFDCFNDRKFYYTENPERLCRLRTSSHEFSRSRVTTKSFVEFSVCSHERAGWLGSRDFGFSRQDLGKRAGNLAI